VSVETAPKPGSAKNIVTVTTPPNFIESPIKVKNKMNGSVGRNVIEVETIEDKDHSLNSSSNVPPIIFGEYPSNFNSSNDLLMTVHFKSSVALEATKRHFA
jgi:hypothetical protein